MSSFSTKISSPYESFMYYEKEIAEHLSVVMKFFFTKQRGVFEKKLISIETTLPSKEKFLKGWIGYVSAIEHWGDASRLNNYRLFIQQLNEIYPKFDLEETLRRILVAKSAIISHSSYFIADSIITINDEDLKTFIFTVFKNVSYVLKRSGLFDTKFSFLDEEAVEKNAFSRTVYTAVTAFFNHFIHVHADKIGQIRAETEEFNRDPKAELERQQMMQNFLRSFQSKNESQNVNLPSPKEIDCNAAYSDHDSENENESEMSLPRPDTKQRNNDEKVLQSTVPVPEMQTTAVPAMSVQDDSSSVATGVTFSNQTEIQPFQASEKALNENQRTQMPLKTNEMSSLSSDSQKNSSSSLVSDKIARLKNLLNKFKNTSDNSSGTNSFTHLKPTLA